MIVLDTNVVSALMMEEPDALVAAWLDSQARLSVWTTSITIFEIRFGLDTMAIGRRRKRRESEFEKMLRNDIQERVLNFDLLAAQEAGALMARRRRHGRSVDLRDTMIAGIALAQRATLATRNVRHFDDLSVPVVNPWQS
jgi:toxin FitB